MIWNPNGTIPRFLSEPMRIHWAGWVSDTLRLQHMGWEFSANQDIHRQHLQLALRHPGLRMAGMTHPIDFRFFEQMDPLRFREYFKHIQLECNLASSYTITEHRYSDTMANFEPVDMTPCYSELNTTTFSLDDLKIFKPINAEVQEVYLHEPSIAEILEMALAKQEHKQAEIRKKMVQRAEKQKYLLDSEVKAELRLIA